ncbi:MAG: isoleucine--tRNA ligase [Nitrospiria bacterium]
MDKKTSYKHSLHLPKTDFPMRANLAQREASQLSEWDKTQLCDHIQTQHVEDNTYILHDGPPYANGHIHIGHALNKILKDIIVKSKTMSGYRVPYVPGWDCHGLPIEHQVLKKLGSKKQTLSLIEIRKRCREYAEKFVEIQKEEFKRLGVFGDWEHPYLTLTPDYEAAIVREFAKVYATGGVYKGKKPVLWCAYDETALAEAEVEYADHASPSIYVKFPLRGRQEESLINIIKDVVQIAEQPITHEMKGRNLSIVIWTTTPWTLVANQAIALHPLLTYVVFVAGSDAYIVARELFDSFTKETLGGINIQQVGSFTGAEIEGWEFSHPWIDRPSPIVLAEHVTLEQGTGCVHTAPGHGQEDYEVGLQYRLEVYAPVDHRGRFTEEAGPFSGLKVFDANAQILSTLREHDALLHAGEIAHSYPHCWRCKRPVIFRATEQWFISMSANDLRTRALKAITEDVAWIPKWGQDRIEGMIANRPDWCISRQRVWGVPIVAFACRDCKETFTSKEIIDHVADEMKQGSGSDLWFLKPAEALLPEGTICPKCGGGNFIQEQDILDVWFESGVSHAAVLKTRPELAWPADLYLEGSDQHRGWFHSTLLAALMTDNRVPYKAVLTHGFVVDGAGKKMSKSEGNVIAPQEVIQRHGADILRLWVAATDFREDIRISSDILTQMVEAYRKIRNTCRFLLGNLYDFSGADRLAVSEDDFQDIDRWAQDRLHLLNQKVQQAYQTSTFHVVFHALNNFCAVDLSAFYLDILKDRLYTSAQRSPERRAAQAVMQEILLTLVRLMAPILTFTAEEIWTHLPTDLKKKRSVHLCSFIKAKAVDSERLARWDRLIRIREAVARVLETARKERKIGNPLEAAPSLFAKKPVYQDLNAFETFLPALFIVSQVRLQEWKTPSETARLQTEDWSYQQTNDALGIAVQVGPARGEKCERCWVFGEDFGSDPRHPRLCRRCTGVLRDEDVDAP